MAIISFWCEIWQEYTWNIPGIYKVRWKNVSCGMIWCYSMCSLCRSVPRVYLSHGDTGTQFFRSKRAGWHVLEFPFSVICAGCRDGQKTLTGPKLRHMFTRHMGARKPDFHVETRWFTCTRIPFCDVLRRLQNRSGVTNKPETWCKRFISEQSTIVDIIGCNWSIIFGVVMCRTWPPWPFVRHAPKS